MTMHLHACDVLIIITLRIDDHKFTIVKATHRARLPE